MNVYMFPVGFDIFLKKQLLKSDMFLTRDDTQEFVRACFTVNMCAGQRYKLLQCLHNNKLSLWITISCKLFINRI